MLEALCDWDAPDASLLRDLRPRALAAARLAGFEDARIVTGYARAGDADLASIIANDARVPAASRAAAAIELCLVAGHLSAGLTLADSLASVDDEPVAVRRAIAARLADLISDHGTPQSSGAIALARRIVARDSSYWVRDAAIHALLRATDSRD